MCTTMNELEKVVADYRSLKAMKEELDAQLKDAEREMISYLDNNNKLSESGKDFTIKVTTCERRTLDSKQLEALFIVAVTTLMINYSEVLCIYEHPANILL